MDTPAESIRVDSCRECGKRYVSPACVCSQCGGEEFAAEHIPGDGKIYSHTTIRIAPEAFQDEVPYPMAIVELSHGLRLTARMQLEEGQEMMIGGAVRCVGSRDSGYWFALQPSEDANG